MNKKSLGPPPDWISGSGEQPPPGPDPLRSIFSEARTVRQAEPDELPGLLSIAHERMVALSESVVTEEIKRRLREEQKATGIFSNVYAMPSFSSDVPEAREARLVIFGPAQPHAHEETDSPAIRTADSFLNARGTGPRRYRNTLVFLAADKVRLEELKQTVRAYLAWKSMAGRSSDLTLDAAQLEQVSARRDQCDAQADQHLYSAYCWALAPVQTEPTSEVRWRDLLIEGPDPLAERTGRLLQEEWLLFSQLEGSRLRHDVENVKNWFGPRVDFGQLVEYFALYPCLPRLSAVTVLQTAIGLAQAEKSSRATPAAEISPAARKQERIAASHCKFHAQVQLSGPNFMRDAAELDVELLRKLCALGGGIKITLQVEAEVPAAAPEESIDQIMGSCQRLKLSHYGLESE